jgi:predicted membrane protein
MSLLDIFSLLILLVIIALVVGLLLLLAWLPGNLAKKRHSPWAEAINVAGWIGILLPPIWMLALISAFLRPRTGAGAQIAISETEAAELSASINPLAERMANLETAMRQLLAKSLTRKTGGQRS